MKLYANPTSPFVRVARMALIEKGLADTTETVFVDAWGDAPDFLDANPAGRVPALVTVDGTPLTESGLIVNYLDRIQPEPPLVPAGDEAGPTLSRAGRAFGVFDAAVAVIIGRKSAPGFDGDIVGRKRYRTMRDGITQLDAALPAGEPGPFDLDDMASVTALDYLALRFPDTDWRALAPRVAALHDAHAGRRSVRETAPKA